MIKITIAIKPMKALFKIKNIKILHHDNQYMYNKISKVKMFKIQNLF